MLDLMRIRLAVIVGIDRLEATELPLQTFRHFTLFQVTVLVLIEHVESLLRPRRKVVARHSVVRIDRQQRRADRERQPARLLNNVAAATG